MEKKYYLVSVGHAVGRDPATGEGWFYAKANSSTAVNMSLSSTDIRGDINNVLQAVYNHTKEITFELTKTTFSKAFLAMNAGTDVVNKTIKVMQTECQTVADDGTVTLLKTPVANVNVFLEEDIALDYIPVGGVITMPVSYAGQKITCVYDTLETIDTIEVQSTTPPKVVDLTLIIQLRDENMNLAYYMQLHCPKAQASGSYSLALSADGVSTETLSLKALVSSGDSCEDSDKYFDAKWVPVAEQVAPVQAITFSTGDIYAEQGTVAQIPLKVLGLRSSIYSNIDLTTDSTIAVEADPAPTAGVTLAGNTINVAADAEIGKTYVKATYGSFTDTLVVEVKAKP